MNNTITEDDLILFIYGEANKELETLICTALKSDQLLREKHQSLLFTLNQLDLTKFQPHDTSLKIIMEESALSQREEIC